MLIVKAKTSELQSTLRLIKSALKFRGKPSPKIFCELTITDNKITIAVPGASFYVNCEGKGAAKASLSFSYFYDIISKCKKDTIEMTIESGQMGINSLTIPVNTTFIENDKILRTIQLPLNYTDKEILNLSKGRYTPEELEFNGMTEKIKVAERIVESNIDKIYEILKDYNVTRKDIKDFIYNKLDLID